LLTKHNKRCLAFETKIFKKRDSVTSLAQKQRDILTTTQHVARSTIACMFNNLTNKQCSTCLTTSWANNVQHVWQRVERTMFNMLDNEHNKQEESFLVYKSLKNTTLLWIVFNLF